MKYQARRFPIERWSILAISLLAFGRRAPFVESGSLTIDEASSLKGVADHTFGYLRVLTRVNRIKSAAELIGIYSDE